MNKYDLRRVPDRSHYALKYSQGGRVFSYAHQIDSVISLEPVSVLEVGPGSGMVTAALRSVGIDVTTADIQPKLSPNVVTSVTTLPFARDAFDVSICCQVLEHLPFDLFTQALAELGRVSCRGVVLSVPDISRAVYGRLQVPKIGKVEFDVRLPKRGKVMARERSENMGHHWEIGYRGSGLGQVCDHIQNAGLEIVSTWRVPELRWHRFFLLRRS